MIGFASLRGGETGRAAIPVEQDRDHKPATRGLESTASLLTRVRAGDRRAANDVFLRFLRPLRRWAHGRLPPHARGLLDTDDLVQNTLRRTLDHMKGFEPQREGAFLAYLRKALINQIRDAVRQAARRPRQEGLPEQIPDPAPSPMEAAVGHEALERYEAALARLSDEDREAVILRIELGLSYPEIAAAVGAPSPNASRMRVVRALVTLAEEVK